MNSRGAATECSPGREPGVFFRHDLSPRGAKESFGVFRPFGAAFPNDTYPGLAPGATLCRRSAAEYSTGFSPSSLRKFPRPQLQLGQIAVARRECALPTQYLLSELLTHHTGIRIPMQKIFSIIIATLLFVVPVCAADINVVTSGAFTAAYTSWPAVLGCQVRHAGRRLAMMGRLLIRVSELD